MKRMSSTIWPIPPSRCATPKDDESYETRVDTAYKSQTRSNHISRLNCTEGSEVMPLSSSSSLRWARVMYAAGITEVPGVWWVVLSVLLCSSTLTMKG